MTPKGLDFLFQKSKQSFHGYIETIKLNSPWDIYTVINPTLIKNPYASYFPLRFFTREAKMAFKPLSFLKNILKFYVKNLYLYFSYVIAFILYRMYLNKSRKNELKILIDIFGLVSKVNQSGTFEENYFSDLYEAFERAEVEYTILIRPYGIGKNPFKLVKFFKIINQDDRDFIFEYELLKFKDFILLFYLILSYPFKTLRLLQKEKNFTDKIFNTFLLEDIQHFSFDSLTRYIFGKNLSKIKSIKKIYSWSEFQVIERSFNYAIRKNSSTIKLIACQFYLNYETYFNTYVDDLDNEMLSSAHEVLVNGEYYLLNRNQVRYKNGVSLRYKDVFSFSKHPNGDNILLLGSYIESDTMHMLNSLGSFDRVLFKNHPAVDIRKFGKLNTNTLPVNDNIYSLFKNASMVIATASGSSVEAVACGISVIIIASQDNFTANPLIDYGKGKIWDIAFSSDDVKKMYNKLITYRNNHADEIQKIAAWYKENFFTEPTEENIIKAFELDKE